MGGLGSFGLFERVSRCVAFLNEVLYDLEPRLFCPLDLVSGLFELNLFYFLLIP